MSTDKSSNTNTGTDTKSDFASEDGLPPEMRERVQEILTKRKGSRGSPGPSKQRDIVDESVVLVAKRNYSDKRYHGYAEGGIPACHYESEYGWVEWDRDEADDWVDPCGVCFPDQESDSDSAPDSGT